jgi:biotin carboxylase
MPEKRVLVIGTTNDYIRLLSECFGKRVLFVTDVKDGNQRSDFVLGKNEEIICSLSDRETTIAAVHDHLRHFEMEASGITCFDCESLLLAAHIAESLQLPFPSPDAVATSRSKYVSKELWQREGISSPRARLIWNVKDIVDFYNAAGCPIVVKPLTGSGSEFVSLCESQIDCMRAYFRLHQ